MDTGTRDIRDARRRDLERELAYFRKAEAGQNNADLLLHARADIDESELNRRAATRRARIEAITAELERRESRNTRTAPDIGELRKREARRKRYALSLRRAWMPDAAIDLSTGALAVIRALVELGEGRERMRCVHERAAKRAGVSVSTVKTTVRKLDRIGALERHEVKVRGKPLNEANLYVWRGEFLRWVRGVWERLRSVGARRTLRDAESRPECSLEARRTPSAVEAAEGGRALPTPPMGGNNCATVETADAGEGGEVRESCRQNDYRQMQGAERKAATARPGAVDVDAGTFETLARPVLERIGADVRAGAKADSMAEAGESWLEELQPGFRAGAWAWGVRRHGRRRAVLAFLQTQLLAEVRKCPGDDRPWNEREPIRNRNSYLAGILRRPPGECAPELTLAALLAERGEAKTPDAVRAELDRRREARRRLGRADDSRELEPELAFRE